MALPTKEVKQDAAYVAKSERQLDAIKSLIQELAKKLDIDASVALWDGSREPLGRNVSGPLEIAIASPGTIGALLRWPTLDNIIRHYVEQRIDLRGGTLLDLGRQLNRDGRSVRIRGLEAARLARKLTPFLFAPSETADDGQGFAGEITGKSRKTADNKDYIQFHYDLSNEFYALFLDPEMVYSCAYFTDWSNDIAQAQHDKLDMICRKLRLKPGERMLDVGAGWGGLLCHAVQNYGVTAHGITLSEEQLAFARDKAKRLGIADRVTFELADYSVVTGAYDKIASIGMYEHIGLKNIPAYMQKMRSLLTDDGLFLNHAISKRAPKPSLMRKRMRPEQRAIAKYIFPGGELDDIGHSVVAMERAGFEVHDVEAWRMHYARTCEIWCNRLTAQKEEALKHISEEKYRIWVAYLAGVSLAFQRG
ncbi:MAG: cyclopropane-fatty-acyl-phospholipid synthase family protein, partial [Pseudomonadota bacterium]